MKLYNIQQIYSQKLTELTQDILSTMDVKCSEKFFRDVAVGTKQYNEFENENSSWKDPNGDRVILVVIDQVCAFIK